MKRLHDQAKSNWRVIAPGTTCTLLLCFSCAKHSGPASRNQLAGVVQFAGCFLESELFQGAPGFQANESRQISQNVIDFSGDFVKQLGIIATLPNESC